MAMKKHLRKNNQFLVDTNSAQGQEIKISLPNSAAPRASLSSWDHDPPGLGDALCP